MVIEFVKFLVKNTEDVESVFEFQAVPAGGGAYFYLLDDVLYHYDSRRKEMYTVFYGNKTVYFTEVRRTK